jgi:hypothetical protein
MIKLIMYNVKVFPTRKELLYIYALGECNASMVAKVIDSINSIFKSNPKP